MQRKSLVDIISGLHCNSISVVGTVRIYLCQPTFPQSPLSAPIYKFPFPKTIPTPSSSLDILCMVFAFIQSLTLGVNINTTTTKLFLHCAWSIWSFYSCKHQKIKDTCWAFQSLLFVSDPPVWLCKVRQGPVFLFLDLWKFWTNAN